MKRRNRTLSIFTLSALDVLAVATGVFVLLLVMLMPYYRMVHDATAETEGVRAAEAETMARVQTVERTATLLRAEAEAALAEAAALNAAAARAEARVASILAAAQATPRMEPKPAALSIHDLDVVFALDTTGSMGRVIRDVHATLVSVIRILHHLAPSLRIGFVAFKDHGDVYVTLPFPLRPMDDANVQDLLRFVRSLYAQGGGDIPEAVDEAVYAAARMTWRDDALGRIIVIGDAPANHWAWERAFSLAAQFHRSARPGAPPRTVSAVLTGNHPVAADFFRRLAAAGGGEFIPYQGQMIESVLLSVLEPPEEQARW
jgi:hypothetical protein